MVHSEVFMNTITATNARSNLFKLLKHTIKAHSLVRISSKEGTAILLSEDEYESLLETAELLSIPGFKKSIDKANKDIKNNDVFSIDEVFNK